MAKKAVLLLIALVFLSSSDLADPTYIPDFGHIVILVHDVSPAYYPELRQLTDLIETYGLQNQTYLFVIPNHGGSGDMSHHPEFVAFLRSLAEKGYHVELHGYDHIGNEFDCDAEEAEIKVDLGLEELESLGFTPKYFIPPRYSLSKSALKVLLSHNLTVIGRDFIYFPDGIQKPIVNREYTWYTPDPLVEYQLMSAEETYRSVRGTFFLSLHPRAANTRSGLEFFREFFEFLQTRFPDP
ncbi:DUF2334 domain-containing protein [Thermococcus sp.]